MMYSSFPTTQHDRRQFLSHSLGGLGLMALVQLLQGEKVATAAAKSWSENSLAARPAPRVPRATSMICLFQHGGPSQMALFDPKPVLAARHGEKYPGEIRQLNHKQVGSVLAAPFKFRRCGESGIEFSDVVPHIGSLADDVTLVRSMVTDQFDHSVAVRTFNSGKAFAGRPTLGAWVTYALGTTRADLPAYVVLTSPGDPAITGPENWSSGFLPAIYQGTPFRPGATPVANIKQPRDVSGEARTSQLQFLAEINAAHRDKFPNDSELAARINNYELAARMQLSVPKVLDFSDESAATLEMYGVHADMTADYGRRCLLARRLVETGVRFVLVLLSGQPWDTHESEEQRLRAVCPQIDRPSAALVKDLKQRGLLDSTIVLWGGEFGRQPVSQGDGGGRDHNPFAASLWLAGGGFKSGYVHGATDEFGCKAIEEAVSVWDLQATLLDAFGIDHTNLSYVHNGLEESLTDARITQASIVEELLT